jgi:1-acyl-sn-glycerol-3-phosphate acyltransferase
VLGDERSLWWRLGAPIARLIERALFRVVVEGADRVPRTGPAILAFNHVSVLDGPCLAIETSLRCRREIRFLVAAEVFETPFFGWVLRCFDQIPIRRGQSDRGALDMAIATLRTGAVVAMAPEGVVNPDPSLGLQRIRSGIARVSLPAGTPVVPVGLWGTQDRWPKSGPLLKRIWRRPVLTLVFGEPLTSAGEPGSVDDIDAFRERVGSAIEAQARAARATSDAR